ncbi:MAG: phosphatidylglycerol lysyltransferase domain-containing protein [Erysipelotrichaceae bacterium]|nr:phosphatidylglycerol lysyltransferase domain-containing protein [Erysipelotrichaceae bacterium]
MVEEKECDFEPVSFEDIAMIEAYLKQANYCESNHNLINLYLWMEYYPLFKYQHPNYLLLLGIHLGQFFMYMPLCKQEYLQEALIKGKAIFDCYKQEFVLSCYTREVIDVAHQLFPKYQICAIRDSYDYIYEVESFKTFSGKKLQKKRNHLNAFYQLYQDRWSYEALSKENIQECIAYVKTWKEELDDRFALEEKKGIVKVLKQYDTLHYIGGVLRIDGKVEGFLIASKLTEDMIQENVEKATASFRGIYQALIQQFFLHEGNGYRYVNREDDLGLENLRQAKLAYNPVYLLEKYRLCRGDVCECDKITK